MTDSRVNDFSLRAELGKIIFARGQSPRSLRFRQNAFMFRLSTRGERGMQTVRLSDNAAIRIAAHARVRKAAKQKVRQGGKPRTRLVNRIKREIRVTWGEYIGVMNRRSVKRGAGQNFQFEVKAKLTDNF